MTNSLYKNTKNNGYYRDYYEPLNIGFDDTDIFIIITDEYQHKPGNLANDLYGSARLGWVFGYFNPNIISDLIFDLRAGMILRVPTKERLLSKI